MPNIIVTADSTAYTADNTTWPTADGGLLTADAGVGGGGRGEAFRQVRPALIVGVGYGVLPELEAEAHGVVGEVGGASASLASVSIAAHGKVGVSSIAVAQLECTAFANGVTGVSGLASQALDIVAIGKGVSGHAGEAIASFKLGAIATGDHDPDEPAIIAMLLAA